MDYPVKERERKREEKYLFIIYILLLYYIFYYLYIGYYSLKKLKLCIYDLVWLIVECTTCRLIN